MLGPTRALATTPVRVVQDVALHVVALQAFPHLPGANREVSDNSTVTIVELLAQKLAPPAAPDCMGL